MLEQHKIAVEGLKKEFVEACKSVFGESLVAIINKGSTVKGGFIPVCGLSWTENNRKLRAFNTIIPFIKLSIAVIYCSQGDARWTLSIKK